METKTFADVLKERIIRQLKQFYPHCKIYDESVKQGLNVPAFNVLLFNVDQVRQLKGHAKRTFNVNINYFPSGEYTPRYECDNIFDGLMTNFRYIGGKHHVHKFEGGMEDDVLVVTFKVVMLLADVVDYIKMQKLEVVKIESRDD